MPLDSHKYHSCISINLLSIISGSSVGHSPDLSCMVVDLPCFSMVRSLTIFLLIFIDSQ